MKKQTAIEFLGHELNVKLFYDISPELWQQVNEIFKQAKAMEKQQSISDYCEGFKASGEGWNGEYGLKDMLDVAGEIDAEDYYNKTYGGEPYNNQHNSATLVIPTNQIDMINTTTSSDTKWALTTKNEGGDK